MIQVCGPAGVPQRPLLVAHVGDVVHEQGGAQRGEDDERDVDPEQQPRMALARGSQHGQPGQLHDRDADVAAARVKAQRPALQPLRVEGVDVGHRGREVAAAHAGERGEPPAACRRRRLVSARSRRRPSAPAAGPR